MNFLERLTGIFVKPGETMKDIIKEPRIEEALLIVGIYAIIYMLYSYISSTRLNMIYDIPGFESGSGLKTFTVVFTLIVSLIMPFIIWAIAAGVLHLFAMVFGGSGKFYPTVLTGIGYSTIVKIFTVIIAAILLTQVPVVTVHISSSNAMAAVNAVQQMQNSIFYMAAMFVMLLGVILSSLLGIFAIKESEKLTMTQAAIVVGIPLAIYVIYVVVTTFIPGMLGSILGV